MLTVIKMTSIFIRCQSQEDCQEGRNIRIYAFGPGYRRLTCSKGCSVHPRQRESYIVDTICMQVTDQTQQQFLSILLGGKLRYFVKGADSAVLVLLVCGGPFRNQDARCALEKYINK